MLRSEYINSPTHFHLWNLKNPFPFIFLKKNILQIDLLFWIYLTQPSNACEHASPSFIISNSKNHVIFAQTSINRIILCTACMHTVKLDGSTHYKYSFCVALLLYRVEPSNSTLKALFVCVHCSTIFHFRVYTIFDWPNFRFFFVHQCMRSTSFDS